MPKAICIVNSKRQQTAELNLLLTEIVEYLGDHSCKVIYTEYAGHAIDLAKNYALHGVDIILAVGGDGTFNEVINGIMFSGATNIILGLIPNGTGNDFCRSQGFTLYKNKILNAIKNKNYDHFDLGKVIQNNKVRYFLNVMDIGFGGLATHILDKQRKKGLKGGISYSIAILRTFFAYKKPNVILFLDQKELYSGEMMMAAVCNGSTFGNGLVIFPGAKANDGKLGLTILGNVSLWTYLINLQKLRLGEKIKHPSIFYSEGRSIGIKILQGNAPIELDGEVFGDGDCHIEIVSNILKILTY